MKVVILAGGYGTRISEESNLKPKPMIEIGGRPILWHIMKYYSSYGHNEFIICCGYKGYVIKQFFADYFLHCSDVTFDFSAGDNNMTVHNNFAEPWRVTLVDTGLNTMTGGRLARVKEYINGERFMLTYGDGVSDVDIDMLIKSHILGGKIATLTAIQPDGRFGIVELNANNEIIAFSEKRKEDASWINGGYFVFEPQIFDFINGDNTVLERDPLEKLASIEQLMSYKHTGFWQCMDTMRDKNHLEDLIEKGNAPWQKW